MEQTEQIMKKEGAEGEAEASSAAHSDTETDSNFLKPDPGLLQSVKWEFSFTDEALVKKELLEDAGQDNSEQQCVYDASTPAGTSGVNEIYCLGDLVNVKYESAEMDIGPTLFQHMDIHYTINKHNMSAAVEENTTVDDSIETMPGSGVRKASVGDEQRDKKTTSHNCSQTTTEMDYDEVCMKSLLTPHVRLEKRNIQKLLHQLRTTSSSGFKCDKTFHKPHLQSTRDKLHRRNSRSLMTTSGTVAEFSNQGGNKGIETKQKPFARVFCEKGHTSKAGVNLHKRTHSNVKLSNYLVNYESHTRKTDEKFAHSGVLTENMKTHTGNMLYDCETCVVKFPGRGKLTKPMRVHTGEKPFQCETCDAKFAQKGTLINHLRVHMDEKPFQCKTCDAKFALKLNLVRHMRVHTGEKPFHCETCDAKFGRKCHLIQHMRVHTGEKPFQCEMCDAKFSQRSNLTHHTRRVHTGKKPFQCNMGGEKNFHCETCDMKFAQKHDLIRHMIVHTGEKPFQCETCDAKFTQSGSLTKHMRRVHTGEKSYHCETCGAKFSERCILTKHVKVHTGRNLISVRFVMLGFQKILA